MKNSIEKSKKKNWYSIFLCHIIVVFNPLRIKMRRKITNIKRSNPTKEQQKNVTMKTLPDI